jgi:hypothetical protein
MVEPVRVFVSHHYSPEEDTFTAQLVDDLERADVDRRRDSLGSFARATYPQRWSASPRLFQVWFPSGAVGPQLIVRLLLDALLLGWQIE